MSGGSLRLQAVGRCVEPFAYFAGFAIGFEADQNLIAHGEEILPVGEDEFGVFGDDVGKIGEEGEVDAGLAACYVRQELPDFVGGEAEDGGDEAGEGFGDAPEGGLGAAAGRVVGCEGIEAVF